MIAVRHRSRNEIASLSTTNNYYRHKSDAIAAIDEVLKQHGWITACCDIPGDDGRVLIPVIDLETEQEQGNLVFAYHRMEMSGHYEITLYLA